jgi:hypothetical protein
LFRLRGFWAGNASGFFLNGALIGTLFFITQFLQVGQVMARCPPECGCCRGRSRSFRGSDRGRVDEPDRRTAAGGRRLDHAGGGFA